MNWLGWRCFTEDYKVSAVDLIVVHEETKKAAQAFLDAYLCMLVFWVGWG